MKVLVADDDATTRELARRYLEREGFVVRTARDGVEALTYARHERPDLVLLGLRLPRLSGCEVGCILRAESDAAVLLLVGRGDDPAQAGGDGYLVKPLSPNDLLASIRAILRRRGEGHRVELLTAGPLVIDRVRREAWADDRPLPLRPKEFDLLAAFAEHLGVTLSRQRILEDVWGFAAPGMTRTVDVHVNHLRRHLAGTGLRIETLRGIGYRLTAPEST